MYQLFSGAIMMGCLISALFFVRFWRETRDRLFIMFAAAFALFSCERLLLGIMKAGSESDGYFHAIRLLGHALIIVAIIDKNRSSA